MAREFAFELGNESPFGELFSFWAFDEESSNLISSKLKPLHVIGQV
jgi:hypothetical protein